MGCDLGVGVTRGVALGVAVTVAVGVGEIVAVAVAVGVGLTVAVAVGLGDTVGVAVAVCSASALRPIGKEPGSESLTDAPVLKKPMFAVLVTGAARNQIGNYTVCPTE